MVKFQTVTPGDGNAYFEGDGLNSHFAGNFT